MRPKLRTPDDGRDNSDNRDKTLRHGARSDLRKLRKPLKFYRGLALAYQSGKMVGCHFY